MRMVPRRKIADGCKTISREHFQCLIHIGKKPRLGNRPAEVAHKSITVRNVKLSTESVHSFLQGTLLKVEMLNQSRADLGGRQAGESHHTRRKPLPLLQQEGPTEIEANRFNHLAKTILSSQLTGLPHEQRQSGHAPHERVSQIPARAGNTLAAGGAVSLAPSLRSRGPD